MKIRLDLDYNSVNMFICVVDINNEMIKNNVETDYEG